MEGLQKRRPPAHFGDDDELVVSRKKAKPVMANQRGKPAKAKTISRGQNDLDEHTSSLPLPLPLPCTQPTNRIRKDPIDSDKEEWSRSVTPELLDTETIHIDESDMDDEPEVEDDVTELTHMAKKWDAPVYVFFKPSATIEYVDGCKAWAMSLSVGHSTSNLRRHAKVCWGGEVVSAADTMGNLQVAREALCYVQVAREPDLGNVE
ncbi:hypothetical protein EI94DRAFT_1818603 [Lactarius quietus]|nr:hypothetical protein EI94DRAFT_1818603 [Lactarius quietus]